MSFAELPGTTPEEPHEIFCRSCRRPLRALRGPRCPWCGMAVTSEDYAAIAKHSQHVLALPDPTPLPTVSSVAQQTEFSWGPPRRLRDELLPRAVRSFQPVTPGQARLRVAVIVLFGVLAAAEIVHVLYSLWALHRMMQMLPH